MDETQADRDDTEKDVPDKDGSGKDGLLRPRYTHVNYLFPCLVYVRDKVNSGELDKTEFEAVVRRNAEEHGHTDYRFPEDFYDILPNQLNHIGWKVFEVPHLIAEQRAAATERREQKAAASRAGGQKKKGTAGTAPSQLPTIDIPATAATDGGAEIPRKKIIVVRKK